MNAADLGTLLVCSVRYAIGRQSYIVEDVCRMVRDNWKNIERNDQIAIARDAREYVASEKGAYREPWDALLDWILEQPAHIELPGARAGKSVGR